MKKRFIGAVLAFLLTAISSAEASNSGVGPVTDLIAIGNGVLVFNIQASRTSPVPACQGSGLPYRFALDATTAGGQVMAATLLEAYALGKQIWVVGTGDCSAWGDTETAGIIFVVV